MNTIEIRQFRNTVASVPSEHHEVSEAEYQMICAMADVLVMHNRMEIGYYEVVMVGDGGYELDSLEAVA